MLIGMLARGTPKQTMQTMQTMRPLYRRAFALHGLCMVMPGVCMVRLKCNLVPVL